VITDRLWRRPRLGIVLLSDRVAVAVARAGRLEDTFSIVNAEQPAEALRAELETRGLRPRTARLGLARSFVVVKALELPVSGDSDLRQMMQFELERHIPFPADEAAFDFALLHPGSGGQRVFVAATERRTVERALSVLQEIRARPAWISVAGHDLVAFLGRRPRGERAVWIHCVGENADVLMLEDGALVASRSVVASDAGALAAEIRGSLLMLRWTECDAVWLSGDGASNFQPAPALGALDLPIGSPPLSVAARRILGDLDDAGDGAALLAAAVATRPGAPRLDLLPMALRPRRLTREQRVTVAMAAVAAVLGLGTLGAQAARSRHDLTRVEAELDRLDPQVRSVQRVMDDLDHRRRLLGAGRAIAATSLHPLPLLRELTETLPPDVWLTTLTLDAKGVEMTGQASTASALIPLLENSPYLEHVEFASPVTRGRDKEQFRIRANWERPTAAPPAAPAGPARERGRPPASGNPLEPTPSAPVQGPGRGGPR
jgi:Tfp pilus assembly protein PilN